MRSHAVAGRRRTGRRDALLAGGVALVSAGLAVPLGRLVAGDAARPVAVVTRATEAPATVRGIPIFVRMDPGLSSTLAAGLAPPNASEAGQALLTALPGASAPVPPGGQRQVESGLNLRAIGRPGEPVLSDREAQELRLRTRPGFVGQEPYKVPFVHTDVIASHLTPDIAMAVSERTRVGVFGQVGPGASVDVKSLNLPNLLNRPLGAGVTLEYRFGTK